MATLLARLADTIRPRAHLTIHAAPPDDEGFMAFTPLSPEAATRSAAVSACVSLLADSIADAEWKVTEPNGVFSLRWSRRLRSRRWYWRVFAFGLLTDGNGFFLRTGNANRPLLPAVTGHSARQHDGSLRHTLTTIDNITRNGLSDEQVVRVHMAGFDGVAAPSPIVSAARDALSMVDAATTGLQIDLRSGARGRTILELDREMEGFGDERMAALTKLLEHGFGGLLKRGRVPILPPGVRTQQMGGPSPVDLQVIELLRWTVEDICRIYKVPPRMIGAHADTQRTGTAFEAQAVQYVRWAVRPLCNLIADEVAHQLLPEGWSAELDPSKQAMGTFGERVTAANAAVAKGGLLTINEGRAVLGHEPREDGDRLISPIGAPDQRGDEPTEDDDARPAAVTCIY